MNHVATAPSGAGAEDQPPGAVDKPKLLDRLYALFGPRYPTAFLATGLLANFPLGVFSVALLSFYIDMSRGEFLAYLVLVWMLSTVAIGISVVRAHRRLAPVRDWISGRRDPETSADAWQTAVALSLDAWPRAWYQQPLIIVVGATLGAVVILDVDWSGALAVFAGTWWRWPTRPCSTTCRSRAGCVRSSPTSLAACDPTSTSAAPPYR